MPSSLKYKGYDYQPEELDNEVVAGMSNTQYIYPK